MIEPCTTSEEQQAAAVSPPDRLVDAVIGRVLSQASGRLLFGEPVTHGERTVIPVARLRYAFGLGGSGGGTR